MTITRRDILCGGPALALSAMCPLPASAQGTPTQGTWPSRTLHWVVGYPAGGPTDAFARLIGERVAGDLGQAVVVENRTGASGTIAAESVVRAQADGHTLLSVDNGTMVYAPVLYDNLSFDPDTDLAKVTLIGRAAFYLVVRNDGRFRSFADLQTAAKHKQILFGSPGVSSPHHLAMEMFRRRAGLHIVAVPHRGMPIVMPELLAGRVDVTVGDATSALPLIRSGHVRALLVLNEARTSDLRDVPTARELGHDVVAGGWMGICVAKATPPDILGRLGGSLQKALASEAVTTRLREQGFDTMPGGAQAFESFAQAENVFWRPLIRELGLKVQR